MSIEHHAHIRLPYLFASADPAARPAPLVLFLHGARDRGTDLNTLLKWGLPQFVNKSASLPYTFAAPQLPEEQTWVDRAADVISLLDELIASHAIDPARVILAGFSLGSAGIWHLATSYPDRFAALVAVSGQIPQTLEEQELAVLKDLSIQIFQGGKDEKLPVAAAEQFAETLRNLGVNVSLTVLPNGDHFIADEVYGSAELQQWLGSVSRRTIAIAA